MNEACKNRLVNWKFSSAMAEYDGNDEDERLLLRALSETFSNCGWFDGQMALIVGGAVDWLLSDRTALTSGPK